MSKEIDEAIRQAALESYDDGIDPEKLSALFEAIADCHKLSELRLGSDNHV